MERRILPKKYALPHLKSASVFARYTAFCFFKSGMKGRSGLVEYAKNPLRFVEFENVAKADFT
jgi:hypothetical protein